jgi:uncharacterized repeat protein (TIGR01451 family)
VQLWKTRVVAMVCLTLAFSVAGLAQPVVSKSFSPPIIVAGGSETMTITITNPTAAAITNIFLSDSIPTGILIGGFGPVNCPVISTETLSNGSAGGFPNLTISIAPLPPNATCSFAFPINAPTAGLFNNTATTTFGPNATVGSPASATLAVSNGDYQVTYAANLAAGESWINISNTAAQGDPLLGPGFGGAQGNMCVNAYAFSADEQLISCCSCLVTPNGLVNLGVNRDLTIKTLTGVAPTSVVVKLVSTLAGGNGTGTSCSNTAATAGTDGSPLNPIGMAAWRTTLHAAPGGGVATTEVPFLPATLSPGELASITFRCASILGNGSGFGVCLGCRAGALGGEKAQ